jgi:hypothetical protein
MAARTPLYALLSHRIALPTRDIGRVYERQLEVSIEAAMSAAGQRRFFADVCITSALLLIPAEYRTSQPVGSGPKGDIAVLYSITSSARESSVDGTLRLSALAVLRLITSSNLVGC